jgi:apolipoprotein D and lipocalin family protein
METWLLFFFHKISHIRIDPMMTRLIFGILFAVHSFAASGSEPLKTVSFVEVPRYMGVWYEIASFPQWFSRDCRNTSATYTLRDDGQVDVLNQCHKGSSTGPISQAQGVAYVANTETNAELKVSFQWPFYGDYWIIELGENYEYAVVSEPGRSTLWILSGTSYLSRDTLDALLDRLQYVHGFDLAKLQYTRG